MTRNRITQRNLADNPENVLVGQYLKWTDNSLLSISG
jgi:hypothetical protein